MKKLLVILLLLFPASCDNKVAKAIEYCADYNWRMNLSQNKLTESQKNFLMQEFDMKITRKFYFSEVTKCDKLHKQSPKYFMKHYGVLI